MIATRELQMEAYRKIDMLSDEDIRLIINIIDKINPPMAVDQTNNRKKRIMDMAGKYDFDEAAVDELRMGSLI